MGWSGFGTIDCRIRSQVSIGETKDETSNIEAASRCRAKLNSYCDGVECAGNSETSLLTKIRSKETCGDGESNGSKIIVTLWILTILPLLFRLLRFYCKARYSKLFAWDDTLLAVAWI